MSKLRFRDMPLSIKVATGVIWVCAWILFEEVVVDRKGLWQYMPYYKVSDTCIWDAAAVSLIAACLYFFGRPSRLEPRVGGGG